MNHPENCKQGNTEKRKALTPFDQKWQAAIKRFLQALGDAEAVPIAGFGVVICKYPLVPISPTCDWGQRPNLESILPQRRP
jgi:hypothetical protein